MISRDYLCNRIDSAVREHNMIEDGDRILVGVSGGKDSTSLLDLLKYRLAYSHEKYEIAAVHIVGDARGGDIEFYKPLEQWFINEGVQYHIRKLHVPENENLPMNCERCRWNRKKTIFEIADELKCNKIALGHNRDDFAQTALMNMFMHGVFESMPFVANYFDGRFFLIRPLAYVGNKYLESYARQMNFPIIPNECPAADFSKRQSTRDLMKIIEKDFKYASRNIMKALLENKD
ncbi:MAG: ATP-binding protein [Thermoplasmata archaeon]|nr:ATP-binding protein [Thermoplasmata archaeon]